MDNVRKLSKEREKIVNKRTRMSTLYMETFIIIGLAVILFFPGESEHTILENVVMISLIIILIISSLLIARYLFRDYFYDQELRQESEETVGIFFLNSKKQQIIPRKSDEFTDLIFELTKRARFYAKESSIDSNMLDITMVFYNETKEIEVESIEKSLFLSYYDIVEDNCNNYMM